MIVAAIRDDVQTFTALVGAVVAVLGLVFAQRQRREPDTDREELERRIAELEARERQEVEKAEDPAAEQRAREDAERKREEARQQYREAAPAKTQRSYKAIASLVLGIIAVVGLFGENVTSDDYPSSDIVVGVIVYGLLAVLFGISALRDIRKDPARGGRRQAIGGIAAAGAAAILLAVLSAAASDGTGDIGTTGLTGAQGAIGTSADEPLARLAQGSEMTVAVLEVKGD